MNAAAKVLSLKGRSGLSWQTLGKLFGVSPLTVQMWASGKRMNARSVVLLEALACIVDSMPGDSPLERRAQLFASRDGEPTPIEQFLDEHRPNCQPLHGPGYTPAELLGMAAEGR